MLARSSLLARRRTLVAVAACVVTLAGARAQDDGSRPPRSADDEKPDFEAFEQAWRTVRDQFYDRTLHGVDWDGVHARFVPKARAARTRRELHEITIAMLGELKSSHTALVEPDVYRDHVETEMKGSLAPTIGIELERLERGYFVSEVIAGGPAAAAGVLRGDRLVHLDGATPEDAGLRPDAWDVGLGEHRGYFPPATTGPVLLELERRPDATKPGYNVYLVRLAPRPWNLIEAVRASARVTEAGPGLKLGYVRLYHLLSADVVDILASLLSEGSLSGTDGLVVDLRGRGGLPSTVEGTIALFDRQAKHGPVYGRPVVAVADSETRSAKEVLAWRWRHRRIGPLVGEHTRGAVLGSRFVPLPDGAFLLLASTDMRVLTGGIVLEGRGVEPDVAVVDSLAYAQGRDPLVEKAMDVLLDRLLLERRTGRHGWY